MRRVLFLCTGNYYRSRFAEEVFNHLCEMRGLLWTSDSRGLHPNVGFIGNRGALSPLARERLRAKGYRLRGNRAPRSATKADFDVADLIVALDRDEHEPLLAEGFPCQMGRVVFWDVKDIAFEEPTEALDKIEAKVIALVEEIATKGRLENSDAES